LLEGHCVQVDEREDGEMKDRKFAGKRSCLFKSYSVRIAMALTSMPLLTMERPPRPTEKRSSYIFEVSS
jgi:hypothetical protein